MSDKNALAVFQNDPAFAALSPDEQQRYIALMGQELQRSTQGVDLKPVRIKINKDLCKFVDPMNQVIDSLTGVIVYKHKARGYWEKGNPTPLCTSRDGRTGIPRNDDGEPQPSQAQSCATCPFNQWGSATNDLGEHTRGKACKEMRRLFIVQGDSLLPIVLTLPPTSLTEFDSFVSARLAQKIADISRVTKFSLVKGSTGSFSFAKIKLENGDLVSPKEVLRLATMRDSIEEAARNTDISDDDSAQMRQAPARRLMTTIH
jgi:hypothetical protein